MGVASNSPSELLCATVRLQGRRTSHLSEVTRTIKEEIKAGFRSIGEEDRDVWMKTGGDLRVFIRTSNRWGP